MDRYVLHEVKDISTDVDGGEPGTYQALVMAFGNVDTYGDRMVKGCTLRSINEHGLPSQVWSHNWSVPPIGTTKSAVEESEGLVVTARLFTDIPIGEHVYKAMISKNGDGKSALRRFSFGYDVVKYSNEKSDHPNAWGGEVRNLEDIDLWECGPCLVGVNLQAELLSVKGVPSPSAVRAERQKSRSAADGGEKAVPARIGRDHINEYLTFATGRR